MKNELVKLIELSKIDAEIDAMAEAREELPSQIDKLQSQLNELENSLNEKKQELILWEKDKKTREQELTEKKDWIAKREGILKEIKTNKEYHAALKEVAQAKKAITDIESALLQLMGRIDERTKELADLEKEVIEKKPPIEEQIRGKKGQIGVLEQQVGDKTAERIQKEKELEEGLLKKYKTIKARLSPAVAPAGRGVCLECNMNIPPQLYLELQKFKQVISCPRCHRILYLET
ncbi:MAG: hypothetical protein HY541_03155 [Deltaproteobacteria bacterium]|nr:hypothetical protein [Deltaproteobacteria bacterium]